MKTIDLGKSGLTVSAVALGCMRIAELADDKLEKLIFTALETGINFFDHADIYGGGESETLLGKVFGRRLVVFMVGEKTCKKWVDFLTNAKYSFFMSMTS